LNWNVLLRCWSVPPSIIIWPCWSSMNLWTSLAPEWCSSLRHCVSVLQTLVWSHAVSLPAVIGSPIGRCTIGPASSGLR
jgi:hypothetical protein